MKSKLFLPWFGSFYFLKKGDGAETVVAAEIWMEVAPVCANGRVFSEWKALTPFSGNSESEVDDTIKSNSIVLVKVPPVGPARTLSSSKFKKKIMDLN